jgi:hypothetical protein
VHRLAADRIEVVLDELLDRHISVPDLEARRGERDRHRSWENFWARGIMIPLPMGLCCFEFALVFEALP